MHDKKKALDIDTRLLKLLKNAYPEIQNICKKLEEKDNNITILSDAELNELWNNIRNLLKNVLNSAKPKIKRIGTTVKTKERNICSSTYIAIVKVALKTLEFEYNCDVLLDVVILLNSALPEINDKQVKDEVSKLLEEWWKHDLERKDRIITNALKHLAENAKVSLQHVKRLNDIKDAIQPLESIDDIKDIMKLARGKTLLEIPEGKDLLIYLFSLGEQWIMGVYNNIRVSLQTADGSLTKDYADILAKAWQNVTENKKTIEECLENLIFHCLRAQRDTNGRCKLGENLFTCLEFFHLQTNKAVEQMICDKYVKLIWRYLEAPGFDVRCNAADVLFMAYPMNVSNTIMKKYGFSGRNSYINKQHSAITALLKDSNEKVCIIALKGMFQILEKRWSKLKLKVINEWLNIALDHTRTSNCPDIRKIFFLGSKNLMNNSESHTKLIAFLPAFLESIHDTDADVKVTVLELILLIPRKMDIKIWDRIPLNCFIECLGTTTHVQTVHLLHELLWTKFSYSNRMKCTKNNSKKGNAIQRIIEAGQININVMRKFFLQSKGIISCEHALKLIKEIMYSISQEIELLPENEFSRTVQAKRHKPNNNEDSRHERLENRVPGLSTLHILVDAAALLYAVNSEEFLKDKFKDGMEDLNSTISGKLSHILENFADIQIRETALFFFSLIPVKSVENCKELPEKCMRNLFDQDVTDDTVLSILHLLIKWNKVDSVLALLLSLLNVDLLNLNINLQHTLAPFVHFETINDQCEAERRTRMWKLGLKILQFLLQKEFQSLLIEQYHEKMVNFWKNLNFIETLIENRFRNNDEESYVLPEDILKILFKHYTSLIPFLHHSDYFKSSNHFSRIVAWVQKEIVPRASDITNLEADEFFISILKCVFDASNVMIAQFKAPPKLCCGIIILYTKCLIAKCGIVFANDALVTVLVLIKFSTDMYKNDESQLLKAVVPSLFAAVMVTLTKYPVNLVKEYTNNLKSLDNLIKNLFSIFNQQLNRDVLRTGYMAILFNTAVFCVSKDFEKLLNSGKFTSVDALHLKFPFISEGIIKIVLHSEGFQDLCIDVLNKAILKYNMIDLLSSLLIIQRLVKTRNKTSAKKKVKRIQNIVSATKEQTQDLSGKNCSTSVRDRYVIDAKRKVIEAILKS